MNLQEEVERHLLRIFAMSPEMRASDIRIVPMPMKEGDEYSITIQGGDPRHRAMLLECARSFAAGWYTSHDQALEKAAVICEATDDYGGKNRWDCAHAIRAAKVAKG